MGTVSRKTLEKKVQEIAAALDKPYGDKPALSKPSFEIQNRLEIAMLEVGQTVVPDDELDFRRSGSN